MKKTLYLFFAFLLMISCSKKDFPQPNSPITSKADILTIAKKYGFSEDQISIANTDSLKGISEAKLNEVFISIKLRSIFKQGYQKSEVLNLASAIQAAMDAQVVRRSNLLMTFAMNARKKITATQMLNALQACLATNVSKSAMRDLEDVTVYSSYPSTDYSYLYGDFIGFTFYCDFQEVGGGGSYGVDDAPPPPTTVSVTPEKTLLPNGLTKLVVTSPQSFLLATLNFTFVINSTGMLNLNGSSWDVSSFITGPFYGTWTQKDVSNVFISGGELYFTLKGYFTYPVIGINVTQNYDFNITYNPNTNTCYITKQ